MPRNKAEVVSWIVNAMITAILSLMVYGNAKLGILVNEQKHLTKSLEVQSQVITGLQKQVRDLEINVERLEHICKEIWIRDRQP